MSRRRHRHEGDHDEHPSEAWLIALADMMTLLMVTFLMMFAIAVVDLQKFKTFARAFSEATGQNLPTLVDTPSPDEVEAEKTELAQPAPPPAQPPVLDRADLEQLREKVSQAVRTAGLHEQVDVEMDRRGLVLYVTSGVLFDSGQARLTPKGGALLDRLGDVFKPLGNDLVIEGHTDAVPIRSAQFPSNWELSTTRATAVLRHLVQSDQLDPRRLSASGYADTRPRAQGRDAAALATNRRVDIVVEAPPPPAAAPAPPAASAAPAAPPEGGHG